jgi:hypothetical protein
LLPALGKFIRKHNMNSLVNCDPAQTRPNDQMQPTAGSAGLKMGSQSPTAADFGAFVNNKGDTPL